MVLCHFSVDHQICFADCPMADFMLTGRFAPVNAQFSAITLQLLILFPVLCLLVTDPTLFLSQQNFLCASSVVFIILIILIITAFFSSGDLEFQMLRKVFIMYDGQSQSQGHTHKVLDSLACMHTKNCGWFPHNLFFLCKHFVCLLKSQSGGGTESHSLIFQNISFMRRIHFTALHDKIYTHTR